MWDKTIEMKVMAEQNEPEFDPKKSYLLKQGGEVEEWTEEHSLKNWQKAVGGYVECVPSNIAANFSTEHVMLVDEEGLWKDYMVNRTVKNGIVGDALLVPGESFE
tara:strand:- start:801 stop:1115 length:315 start_codon:yes stop_codon:yes gene_type:complete